jgi:hypothetical protein
MNQAAQAAGMKAQITLVSTRLGQGAFELGEHWSGVSYFCETGWYNLNPLQWFVNGALDLWRLVFAATPFYEHHVEFINGKGVFVAITGQCATNIDNAGLARSADVFGTTPNWDVAFANVLLHEVLWLGILGETDDINPANRHTLPSGRASGQVLVTITTEEADAINDELGE